jgi:hypothetical protein
MCDASLSFPLGAPVNVCATLLWGQEGHVHWRVTACWIYSPGPLSTASSSEALNEIELLDSWLLAVWWHGWVCDNPGTLSEPTSTELTSLDKLALSLSLSTTTSDTSLGLNNRGLLFLELIIATTHTNCKMLTGKKNKLCMQHCM